MSKKNKLDPRDKALVAAVAAVIRMYDDVSGPCNNFWRWAVANELARNEGYWKLEEFVEFLTEAKVIRHGRAVGALKVTKRTKKTLRKKDVLKQALSMATCSAEAPKPVAPKSESK